MVARASWSYHWQPIIREQGAHGDTPTGSQVAWMVDLTVSVCVCVWWSEDENDGDAHFACNVSSALLCAGDVQFKGAFALCLAQ